MNVDLSSLEQQALQVLGAVILGIGIVAGKRFLAWMNYKVTDAQKLEMEDVTGKALQYGISKTTDMIKARGWDHPDVKSQVIAEALEYAKDKFPGALARAGIDTTDPLATAQQMSGILERKFPEAATVAVASPVTPPHPDQAQ